MSRYGPNPIPKWRQEQIRAGSLPSASESIALDAWKAARHADRVAAGHKGGSSKAVRRATGLLSHEDRLAEKFWARIVKSEGCWSWTGRLNAYGYGVLGIDKRHYHAHRVSWQIHFDAIPEGQYVLHRCDNPPCCNPQHLFLGTQADNMRDKAAKGRQPRGESHGCAKLKHADVPAILSLRASGKTLSEIANQFGVTTNTINRVVLGKSWATKGNS